jgi:catechol-2,3-dioxygenase
LAARITARKWLSDGAGILIRMSDSIKLGSVALDCPDAGRLAAFYAQITGGTVTYQDEDWAVVKGPGGRIDFQTAPGYQPPAWPDPSSSMQMHLDFDVDDADAAEARVLAAGAAKYDFQPGDHFRVYADPAGHPFCLCTEGPLSGV